MALKGTEMIKQKMNSVPKWHSLRAFQIGFFCKKMKKEKEKQINGQYQKVHNFGKPSKTECL